MHPNHPNPPQAFGPEHAARYARSAWANVPGYEAMLEVAAAVVTAELQGRP